MNNENVQIVVGHAAVQDVVHDGDVAVMVLPYDGRLGDLSGGYVFCGEGKAFVAGSKTSLRGGGGKIFKFASEIFLREFAQGRCQLAERDENR